MNIMGSFGIFIQLGLLIIGFVMLVKGADWFVEGASAIADRFGIPQMVIGLTVVAFGTSIPEAAVSISAALKGNAGVTIGNILGSNILNILVILGITSLIIPLTIQKNTMKFEIPIVIVSTCVLLFMGMNDGMITLVEGLILLLMMMGFLAYLLWLSKNGTQNSVNHEDIPIDKVSSNKKKKEESMLRLIGLLLIGATLIILGSGFAVDSAIVIATTFGMSDRLIGLTIIAFGTSLPELITSVTAGMKGKSDIAIGNIVGSNIFNILLVVGVSALVTPVTFAANFTYDSMLAILAAVMLLVFVLKSKTLKRWGGIVMLVTYAVYFVFLIQS